MKKKKKKKVYDDKNFIFVFTRENGKPIDFFIQKKFEGKVEESGLRLGPVMIPYKFINRNIYKKSHISLQLKSDFIVPAELKKYFRKNSVFYLGIKRGLGQDVSKNINLKCSESIIEENFDGVKEEDISLCPVCEMKIITRDKRCNYFYCKFCYSIFDQNLKVVSNGKILKKCPECGYYGRIKKYQEFYFVFLFMFIAWHEKEVFLCDNCAMDLGWRMLLGNLLFLLGIPPTIAVFIETKRKRTEYVKNLIKGTKYCKRGKLHQADEYYNNLSKYYQEQPGLLYNLALSALQSGDLVNSRTNLQRSINACPTYQPALSLIKKVENYQVGKEFAREEKLKRTKKKLKNGAIIIFIIAVFVLMFIVSGTLKDSKFRFRKAAKKIEKPMIFREIRYCKVDNPNIRKGPGSKYKEFIEFDIQKGDELFIIGGRLGWLRFKKSKSKDAESAWIKEEETEKRE